MDDNGTGRKNQAPTHVRSGFVNVESLTGRRLIWLEDETEMLTRYLGVNPDPWMPEPEWDQYVQKILPGSEQVICSLKTMAGIAGLGDWRSFDRAFTRAGSCFHFVKDGPLHLTTTTSFKAGVQNLNTYRQERMQENQQNFENTRLVWTVSNSGSIATGS